jgi:hydroxylamine reductase
MTTNCVVPPKDSYKNRLFTTGATGVPGCKHIAVDENGNKDFSELIAMAKKCQAQTEI